MTHFFERSLAEEKSDVKIEAADNGHLLYAKPTQNGVSTNEEQPSSFFDNLLNIIMKPFSLIASFFGGFFSWLLGSDTDESTSQTDARCEGESSSCDYDATRIDE